MRPSIVLFLAVTPALLSAVTLDQHIQTTLDTNPQLQKRLSDYRAIQYDLDTARAGYHPTVDLSAAIGPEHTEKQQPSPDIERDLIHKEAGVVLTENLFEGFNTEYDIKEQEARIEASRYYVMQEANTLALRASETYLAVLTNKALLDIEHKNVETHERIFRMIHERITAGLGRRSDLEQTESRMMLAYANYIAQQNNYQDSLINFERVNGTMLSASDMTMPEQYDLPAGRLEALQIIALNHNPTLNVERSNIETQTARYSKEKSGFFPSVDAELSADIAQNIDGFENDDRGYRALLRLNYNLYNGGRDEAARLQNIEMISGRKASYHEQERAVSEKLKLAWMSYQYYKHRIRCLELHAKLSHRTAESYAEEYHLGRRSLLDLLNVELEANTAQQEVIKARQTLLFAHYRMLEAMGLLPFAFSIDLPQQVGLETPTDIALHTPMTSLLTQYGETGEYIDITAVCREVIEPVSQYLYDPDKEPDEELVDIITVSGINFDFDSAAITPDDINRIIPVTDKLREDPSLHVEIHGHTDINGTMEYNQKLSVERAESAKNVLVDMGISPDIITIYGHASRQPKADNATEEGRYLNRRIEFVLKRTINAKETGD